MSAGFRNDSFQKFRGDQVSLPSEYHYRYGSSQLVGAGYRWLCMKNGVDLKMIDVLTDGIVWSPRNF